MAKVGVDIKELCVGPIYGDHEAHAKVFTFMEREGLAKDEWHWTGEWWSENGTSHAEFVKAISFPGRIVPHAKDCVASFPGVYAGHWCDLVKNTDVSTACVFFPANGDSGYGEHVQTENGKCWCHELYPGDMARPWGCKWFQRWREQVEEARRHGQELIVVFQEGKVGQGIVRWEELTTDPGSKDNGLGGSQKGEVAWLLKHGYDFKEMDVSRLYDFFKTEKSGEATSFLESDETLVTDHEVHVEVLSASDLAAPEYRLGDLTASYLGGDRLSSVYVKVRVGQRTFKTKTASVGPERHADFSGERLRFSYSSEAALTVKVCDERGWQAMLRGDPLIGKGHLSLQDLRWDELPDLREQPQLKEVPLERNGKGAGVVSLRFQMLPPSGGRAAAPN